MKRYYPANEPDIAYPYLFSYYPEEAWRTQKEVRSLLEKHYKNEPDGIPGNDDTGTMSAWAVFSMMGFYPDIPGVPEYTLTTPAFERVVIRLDPRRHGRDSLVFETTADPGSNPYTHSVKSGEKQLKGFRISHQELIRSGNLQFRVESRQK